MTVVAAVLAAGGGRRFAASGGQGHKLLAPLRGRPLVAWALEAVVAAGFDEVLVVSGSVDLSPVLAAFPVEVAANPAPEGGIATSLAVAVDHAAARGAAALVVGLGDQPGVVPAAWRAVADESAAPVAVATYGGRRGNPVRLGREVWPLLPRTGDEGARRLMGRRPDLVAEVACPGDPFDVDRVEDLGRWS
ncbi:MAG: NTP transferase domain-containing protein [Acidimicrobiia bacterium]